MSFVEGMEKHDEHILMQLINSWTNMKVNINGMAFEKMEEIVTRARELSLEGKNWHKQARVSNEMSLRNLFLPKEELGRMRGGFSREDLPKPWGVIFYAIM